MSDLPPISLALDGYARTARLAPGLLLIFGPTTVAVGAGVAQWPTATTIVSIGIIAGLPLALAEWVRRHGQAVQRQLWSQWGGNPVIVALRSTDLIGEHRRNALAKGTRLPVNDPNSAVFEEGVGNAVRQLISATRDTSRYPLVFAENKNYGFARNTFAIRTFGRRLSVAALLTAIVLAGASVSYEALTTPGTILGSIGAAIATAFWNWYPREERVHAAAIDYRDRLLEALDQGALDK